MSTEIGFTRRVLEIFEDYKINVEHIPTGIDSVSVVVSGTSVGSNMYDIVARIESELGARVRAKKELALIAIVGRNMVGKNGISKMVLRKTLPIINANITRLLTDTTDFNVEVAINEKNDINFYLIKDGVKSDLTSGSGFERTAAALALRAVLGNMSTLPKINFLVLDEILGRVAKENYDNMRTLFEKIMENYDAIIQISHLNEIKDWHEKHIVVSKENNVSKIHIL